MSPGNYRKWSSHLGNAITIATGVPVVMSAIAGIWAYLSGPGLPIAIVVLAVFMMTLWCCIGFLWLRDRTKSQSAATQLDCSWGLRVDGAFLTRDVTSAEFEWQVALQLRNVLSWPVRIDTMRTYLEIESVVPNTRIDVQVPVVLTAGATYGVHTFYWWTAPCASVDTLML
jgi:hypothetical protein